MHEIASKKRSHISTQTQSVGKARKYQTSAIYQRNLVESRLGDYLASIPKSLLTVMFQG
ncbi:hypothetical protein [Tolypothrix sp. VBCCA 56010]|uniref:hypothetical protein n=1 Tax=Tolypothrix sp. VBCCA 56010 TaxID=3137731 RepID=UPI003D7D76F0